MPRTVSIADSYITNIEDTFAREVYANALLRGRGINQKVCYNKNFPIFDQALEDNSLYDTLTPLERDSIIDFLLR